MAIQHRRTTRARMSEWAAREWRSFTLEELTRLHGAYAARSAIEAHVLERVASNLYASAEHASSFFTRADAALRWAGEGSSISGRSAMFLWKILDSPPEQVEVAVWHERRLMARPPWLRISRVTYPRVAEDLDGWSVMVPEMALAQGFGFIEKPQRVAVVLRACASQLVEVGQVAQALKLMPRVRERRELMRALGLAVRGAESYLEAHALLNVFNLDEFAGFIRQHRVRTAGGNFRLDMYEPTTRVAVETDGAKYHAHVGRWQHDIQRGVELAALGILTVRFSYTDLTERPQWCRARLREVQRSRRMLAA